MKFSIAVIAVTWIGMNGCAGVADYPNDSPSRVLNEMKRPVVSGTDTTLDARDARIAALEQEVSTLRARETRAVVPIASPMAGVEKTFVIVLRDEQFFASGSAKPTQDVINTLRRTAEILKPYAGIITRIRVDGYTDNRPIHTKQFTSNQHLSQARAQVVARHLQRETGFPAERFTVAGHGAANPVASNATVEGRTRNRRVEIAITSTDATVR